MARGRMINRKVATSGKVAALAEDAGAWAMVFHHRLIAFLDKNGNCRADPYWLKAEVMPRVAGVTPEDCRTYVAALVRNGLAVLYQVDGMPYLHMPGFRDEQSGLRPDRESPDVPVPQGFDEDAGTMPASIRQAFGNAPAECPPEVEGEVEIEQEDPPGVAHAREALDPPPVEDAPDDDAPPEVPGDTGTRVVPFRPLAARELDLPFAGQDWAGRVSGSVVLREWINLQPAPPGQADRDRYGRAAKQLADQHTCGTIALAFHGMRYLWPYGDARTGEPREPWTPEDLRRVFVKAFAAAGNDPRLRAAREDRQLDDALDEALERALRRSA